MAVLHFLNGRVFRTRDRTDVCGTARNGDNMRQQTSWPLMTMPFNTGVWCGTINNLRDDFKDRQRLHGVLMMRDVHERADMDALLTSKVDKMAVVRDGKNVEEYQL